MTRNCLLTVTLHLAPAHKNEETYKSYKNLFETVKKRSKKKFYIENLQKFKGDARKTWSVMKEMLGKCTT